MRRKLPYREGDWVLVPHEAGLSAVRIARCDGQGSCLGYVYLLSRRPSLEELALLRPAQADAVYLFGDLGLLEGHWEILGQAPGWRRQEWPVPAFSRQDLLDPERYELIRYDEKLRERSAMRLDPQMADRYPADGWLGYGAVEIALAQLARARHPGPLRQAG